MNLGLRVKIQRMKFDVRQNCLSRDSAKAYKIPCAARFDCHALLDNRCVLAMIADHIREPVDRAISPCFVPTCCAYNSRKE
jgi:hypothetical protein